jgi:hypothetical protein
VSQGSSSYIDVGAIRACSIIEDILVDKPKIIFSLFKRLGIYEWKHVYDLAKSDIENDIMAIRFSHIELFEIPIKLDRIREIFAEYDGRLQLQSPSSISRDIFMQIYDEGFQNK